MAECLCCPPEAITTLLISYMLLFVVVVCFFAQFVFNLEIFEMFLCSLRGATGKGKEEQPGRNEETKYRWKDGKCGNP